MTKRILPILSLSALLSLAAAAETVEIRSAADWDNFAGRVNAGESALCAILMRDVTLTANSPRCGDVETRYFAGDFDGNGKTLTLNWSFKNTYYAAPFGFVSGCTIHDLHVAGSIASDMQFSSGLVGRALPFGNVSFTRCRCSAAITNTFSGAASFAGFVGRTYWKGEYYYITFTDCLFDGALLGPTASHCGGFVVRDFVDSRIKIYNSLFDPREVTASAENSGTFVATSQDSAIFSSSSIYRRSVLGAAQGTDASGMGAAALAAALGSNWQVVGEGADAKAVPKFVQTQVEDIPDPNCGALAFTYQGALRDAQGNALAQKSHTIEFRLYDQATGGSPHWGRRHSVKLDEEGNFAVEISDAAGSEIAGVPGTGLAEALAKNAGSSLYLGLAVDGGSSEISPRQKLLAAPSASYAADASSASGDVAVAGDVRTESVRVLGVVTAKEFSSSEGIKGAGLKAMSDVEVSGDLAVEGTITGNGAIPVGGIIPWWGVEADVPKGWAACNGQVSSGVRTPDLRSRFIIGAGGSYPVTKTGGAEAVALTAAQMPAHTHELYGRYCGYTLRHNDDAEVITYYDKSWGSMSKRINTSESAGGGQAHENRPPYYALIYIMRVE